MSIRLFLQRTNASNGLSFHRHSASAKGQALNLTVLGQRIKGLREKLGLKQRDVAGALQISAQAVSKWERDENYPDIFWLETSSA